QRARGNRAYRGATRGSAGRRRHNRPRPERTGLHRPGSRRRRRPPVRDEMMRSIHELRQRRSARRWQRWSEVDPLDDYARRAGFGVALAFALFFLLVILLVVGLVIAR